MEHECYYVYSKGILGVKTNISNFQWVYGSVAPSVGFEEYENCIVKFDISIVPEKKLSRIYKIDQRFQAYTWDENRKTISCRRILFRGIEIGYDIKFDNNMVVAEIGKHYYRYVKNRMMNLHGIYYLLSDIANVILLDNGFITLYASSVCNEPMKKGIVNFAPPNTGKTYTAMKLCELSDYTLVGEDIVISDGYKVYSCPWTNSYRNSNRNKIDSAGAFGRTNKRRDIKVCEECELTDLTVLAIGESKVVTNKDLILKQVSILNGYLFSYYSSPIVKLMGYFCEEFNKPWSEYSNTLLEKMVSANNCYLLQIKEGAGFSEILHKLVSGKKI